MALSGDARQTAANPTGRILRGHHDGDQRAGIAPDDGPGPLCQTAAEPPRDDRRATCSPVTALPASSCRPVRIRAGVANRPSVRGSTTGRNTRRTTTVESTPLSATPARRGGPAGARSRTTEEVGAPPEQVDREQVQHVDVHGRRTPAGDRVPATRHQHGPERSSRPPPGGPAGGCRPTTRVGPGRVVDDICTHVRSRSSTSSHPSRRRPGSRAGRWRQAPDTAVFQSLPRIQAGAPRSFSAQPSTKNGSMPRTCRCRRPVRSRPCTRPYATRTLAVRGYRRAATSGSARRQANRATRNQRCW